MAFKRSDFTKEYYAPREVAVYVGVSSRTISNYCREGFIKEERTPTDRRRIPREAVLDYLAQKGLLIEDNELRRDVIYARVSSKLQVNHGDLDKQVQDLLLYVAMQNPQNLEVIKEVGSGTDDSRKQLGKLLTAVLNKEISRIFILSKDRLTRFGYGYLEQICNYTGTKIVVLSSENNKRDEGELADDFIAIIRSLSDDLHNINKKDWNKILKEIDSFSVSQ